MGRVWVQLHDGKVVIVHPGGYLAFTPEEWEDLKHAGDMALCDEEPPPPRRKPKVIPGWLALSVAMRSRERNE